MKRWIYLLHRWLGIGLCVLMAMWFVSGAVMLYVGYPKLSDDERRAGLPALDAARCCVPLAQALDAAGFASASPRATWRLTSIGGVPTYVLGDGARRQVAVDARSGRRIGGAGVDDALHAARHFAGPDAAVRDLGSVVEDAWTHSRALDAHRPLHRMAVDGGALAGRWLYVSSRTGEIVRDATRAERTWGWLGAWLHWLYVLRGGPLDGWWSGIVIALSIAGSVLAAAGLVVGVWRWRFGAPYRSGRRTPYAGRAARWHHVLGLAGGVLALTWVVSGLLSLNPWRLFDSGTARLDLAAYAGGALRADGDAPEAQAVFARLAARGIAAREIEWRRVGGVHHVLAWSESGAQPHVVDAGGLRPDGVPAERWQAAVHALLPGARIVARQRLERHDLYYVEREPHTMTGQRGRPLPAWRLRFDDAAATWITIDPHSGDIVQVLDGPRRASRWLFAFLHSFDLPALLGTRPLWDAWMVAFSVAGLGISLTGVVTGWRRLRRRRPPRADAAA